MNCLEKVREYYARMNDAYIKYFGDNLQEYRPVDEIVKLIREHNLQLIYCRKLPHTGADFKQVTEFYKNTEAKIYKDQKSDYSDTGVSFTTWYEIKAIKQ